MSSEEKNYIDYILEEIEEVTPEKGYVVCEFDEYGKIGEKLTIIKYVDNEEEANNVIKSNPDRRLVFYGEEE